MNGMLSKEQEHCCKEIALCESVAAVGKELVTYRLSVGVHTHARSFFVYVEMGGEDASVSLGDDLERAVVFYRQISDGLVTPCTLEEIFEDFA